MQRLKFVEDGCFAPITHTCELSTSHWVNYLFAILNVTQIFIIRYCEQATCRRKPQNRKQVESVWDIDWHVYVTDTTRNIEPALSNPLGLGLLSQWALETYCCECTGLVVVNLFAAMEKDGNNRAVYGCGRFKRVSALSL